MGESEQAVMTWQNEMPAGSTEQQTTTMKPLRTKTQPPSVLASLIPLFIPYDCIVLKSSKENSTFSRQDLIGLGICFRPGPHCRLSLPFRSRSTLVFGLLCGSEIRWCGRGLTQTLSTFCLLDSISELWPQGPLFVQMARSNVWSGMYP